MLEPRKNSYSLAVANGNLQSTKLNLCLSLLLCVIVRAGESLQNCPYLAVWSMDPVVQIVSSHILLDVVVHDRSLSRGLPVTCPPPEQYFNPTTYNFGRCI